VAKKGANPTLINGRKIPNLALISDGKLKKICID
jgi:hypothetical protein